MARITLSGIATDLRGSVGGSTFQQSQGGLVMKNKSNNIKRISLKASTTKGFSQYLNQTWRMLTEPKRLQWNQYASFLAQQQHNNPGLFISGQNIFFRYNYYQLAIFQTYVDVPVFGVSNKLLDSLAIANNAGALEITFGRAIGNNTEMLWLELSNQIPQSQKRSPSGTKVIPQLITNGTTFDITNVYNKFYGVIPATGAFLQAKWTIIDLEVPAWTTKAEKVIEIG